ncbi:DUF2264 domain-containing protein [Sphingobacterium sp. UT-1RO-CII-1]|uniref:DUF2264 domain-containing protein n=1 Tax=Sphingobacterium sp. UT-1RO-CII-1 TaxID=2995225 RepID=UPI00227A87FB|nr:DUF2264 domain-containing protein [Sphingobacterium sp. UT-1RO-CII-1]MCY4779293.1 DUF2264 domain-containing protein [Sphingobacterium sp. UT-1RO-CII-1]
MKRRTLLKTIASITTGTILSPTILQASPVHLSEQKEHNGISDREYWVSLLSKMATPILENISKGELQKNMPMPLSPSYDSRGAAVGYLEAFGRLIAGIAPWLTLPDDESTEGQLRKKFKKQILLGIQHGVDPNSPDYFAWRGKASQPLVDAAFLVQGLLRAPDALWHPLPSTVKEQLITELKLLRRVKPYESNWLLFAAMTETFLYYVGEECDRERIDHAVHRFDKDWYVGDGWYSDGARFSFDHYNAYVIHSLLVEVLQHNITAGAEYQEMYDRAYKRMQRYAHHVERMISPEGYPLVVGRSSTYRNAAFQSLASVALDGKLPADISKGQVRAGLTAVLKHTYKKDPFDSLGWLHIGYVGDRQQDLGDSYTNAGSLYMASLSFLPLGLPATDDFWTCAPEKWTSQKVFDGDPFPKDYVVSY